MKGQVAVEVIVILSVLLIVFLGILATSQTTLFNVSSRQHYDQTGQALDLVASLAEDVYYQGEGAKQRVYISLPSTVATSSVSGSTLQIDVLTSQATQPIVRIVDFTLNGTLPNSSGNYWVTAEVFSTYVNISY